jgi:hypothetical protein
MMAKSDIQVNSGDEKGVIIVYTRNLLLDVLLPRKKDLHFIHYGAGGGATRKLNSSSNNQLVAYQRKDITEGRKKIEQVLSRISVDRLKELNERFEKHKLYWLSETTIKVSKHLSDAILEKKFKKK